MNALQRRIIDEIVKPEMQKMVSSVEGHILQLYDANMFADVRIQSINGSGQQTLFKVPIQMGSGGMSQSGPFKGDKVIVNFKNNNQLMPVIVSILETNFDANWQQTRTKHSRKGAVCPDSICARNDWAYGNDMYSASSFDFL